MSRVAPKIDSNENDMNKLKSIVCNELSAPYLVKKAQAILKCMEGKENKAIAQELGVRRNTVGDWRKEYIKDGIEGLKRKKRSVKREPAAPDTPEYVSQKSGALACSDHKRTNPPLGQAAETLVDPAWEEGISLNVHHKDGGECRHETVLRNEEIIIDRDTGDAETQTKEENLFLDPSVNNVMNIHVDVCDRYGNKIQKQIQLVNGLPAINEIHYESPLTLSASIGDVETGISKGLGKMAKSLCEGYMDMAYKKSRFAGRRAETGGDLSWTSHSPGSRTHRETADIPAAAMGAVPVGTDHQSLFQM